MSGLVYLFTVNNKHTFNYSVATYSQVVFTIGVQLSLTCSSIHVVKGLHDSLSLVKTRASYQYK